MRLQAEAEGLTLLKAENSTGYFGVHLKNPGHPKPYQTRVTRGGASPRGGRAARSPARHPRPATPPQLCEAGPAPSADALATVEARNRQPSAAQSAAPPPLRLQSRSRHR